MSETNPTGGEEFNQYTETNTTENENENRNEYLAERRKKKSEEVNDYYSQLLYGNLHSEMAEQKKEIESLKVENKNLDEESRTDFLTKLNNLKHFDQKFPEQINDIYDKEKQTLNGVVIIIDMDGMGDINNSYDHEVADGVIKNVAQGIHDGLRETDWAIRRSGDEFLVVLGAVEESEIEKAFESFRDRISKKFKEPIVVKGHMIPVGVSMGFAAILKNEKPKTMTDLLSEAEVGMHAEKQLKKKAQESKKE